MGYAWRVWLRISGSTRDLQTLIASTKGPTFVDLLHEPVFKRHETINGRTVLLAKGYRCRVGLTFEISGTMTEHATIQEIVNALLDSTKTVEISLDNQTVYKVCEIRKYDGPDPWGRVTKAGATYKLEVECQDLLLIASLRE